MRFTIFVVFLLLALAFGRLVKVENVEPDFEALFAEEEEEEELAGWKCSNGKYPYSRWGDQNACEFTCKGSCFWSST